MRINGAEICHQIKSNHNTRHIPVVLVSAHPCVLNLLGSYGCDAFIAKLFNITELFGRMDDCLGNVA